MNRTAERYRGFVPGGQEANLKRDLSLPYGTWCYSRGEDCPTSAKVSDAFFYFATITLWHCPK
ncbi:hypothetical protein ACFLXE_05850 [Chloroflexota bacterium]